MSRFPNNTQIQNVSDTSLWVAHYRALETDRKDALFHDPFAKTLVGERGIQIAQNMRRFGRYTAWSVVMRTVIIDRFLQELIQNGVDTVLNLGAGLDTRPYRMKLPNTLQWIEVDYPNIIQHKNTLLKNETPQCKLERMEMDLSNEENRKKLFTQLNGKKIVVITEGVIPYLTQSQVSSLAKELYQTPNISFWITEFLDPKVYPHLKRRLLGKKLKKAPFQFFPEDWLGFFKKENWIPKKLDFLGEESLRHHREIPMPWWTFFFMLFAKEKIINQSKQMTGYLLLEKK